MPPNALSRQRSPGRRLHRQTLVGLTVGVLTAVAAILPQQIAHAAGETVNIWLTTTNDSAGRNVTRGLQQQAPVAFGTGTGSAGQVVTVNENTRYQQFIGAGASFTDTAAWLMNSSGALTAATRNAVMTKLFDPANGIGLDFLRNPMGASDLARFSYSYDDVAAGQTDPGLARFSISHDLADVVPLTRQALQLNPNLKVLGSPWTAPPWMKDNGSYVQGWLQAQYYSAYAQYFVKYVQAYAAQGIPIHYVTPQNEPGCCAGYPSMQWNANGLDFFTASNLLPALHAAGLSTKVLIHDWNWDGYSTWGAPLLADNAIRGDSLFGGIAWHGYGGNVSQQSTVHNQYPAVDAFDTEHSGGTWIANQQNEDMNNIISYTRNWGRTVTKWSLAVDQNMGPHNGGCGTCTGLITVHNGDGRTGQVDYTVEYYDTGHLTKFVKPGAYRIASTANTTIPNVAWLNPDGSKALVAYNGTGSAQTLTVNWGTGTFSYSIPAATSATFTWSGTQGSGGSAGPTGPITGLGGKCVDVAGANPANGTQVQLFTCNGTSAQQWTVAADGSVQSLGKCLDVAAGGTADGTKVQLYDCNGSAAQKWTYTAARDLINPQANKCLDVTGASSADGTALQIWTCTGSTNQKWTVPIA
jgi:glucosylceramidase